MHLPCCDTCKEASQPFHGRQFHLSETNWGSYHTKFRVWQGHKKQGQANRRLGKKKIQEAKDVPLGIVMANNHFEGFGPATANSLRMQLGMRALIWHEKKIENSGNFLEIKIHRQSSHQKSVNALKIRGGASSCYVSSVYGNAGIAPIPTRDSPK